MSDAIDRAARAVRYRVRLDTANLASSRALIEMWDQHAGWTELVSLHLDAEFYVRHNSPATTPVNPDEARQIAATLTADQGGQWARDDLPSRSEVISLWLTEESRGESADAVLGAVVAHLNAHHPKPDADSLLYRAERAERERDAAVALRAVLELCDETTIQVRPHGGGDPYMVVSVPAIRKTITDTLQAKP